LAKKEGTLLKGLNRKIKIIDCDKLHIRSCLFDLIKYFNIEKPDYFISSLDYTNIIASLAHKCSKSKSKLVIWEHNTLSIHSKETICKYHYLNNIVIRYFYKRADRIIAVSKGVKDDLIKEYNLQKAKIDVIYNPVFNPTIIKNATIEDNDEKIRSNTFIVAVGRLAKQKNYFNLIEAYKILMESKKINHMDLVIIGEGPEKDNILYRINQLKLNERIMLTGFKSNPFPLIKKSSIFVLSSDWEGLAIVLIEALALKKQIVSTDCPNGPREILDNGKYGLLVPVNDPHKLAEGIYKIIGGKVRFDEKLLFERAQDFCVDKSLNQFIKLISSNGVT
jgi:glycosyltransferase involved in cell wall biosynthesis